MILDMIKFKEIPAPTCEVYGPDDKMIGGRPLNEYEFNEVRFQIVDQGLEGYYAQFSKNGVLIRSHINEYGVLEEFPPQFDLMLDQLEAISISACKKYKKNR